MKKQMKWLSLTATIVMLIATASPIYAQSETDPQEDPPVIEESNSFLNHPIVQVLSDFFASFFEPKAVEDSIIVDETSGEEPEDVIGIGEGEEPVEEPPVEEPTPVPILAPDEQIAALHSDQDLGFGEIAKLVQIAAEAEIACTTEGANCDVSLDSLLEEYNSGVGMGELFAAYGKPAVTGVGQTKKEYGESGEKIKTNNGKAKGKDKKK